VYLLWHEKLPTKSELEAFDAELRFHRQVPVGVLNTLKTLPRQGHPMNHLRTAVSMLGIFEVDGDDTGRASEMAKALRLTAQFPTLVAAIYRISQGAEPVAPRPDLGHAANFLYMMFGREQPELFVKAMDMGLILHADHEFNASTFTAREIASTLSDMHSAVVGAIGALKGPLHGGANEGVMRTLLEIGSLDKVEGWLTAARAAKRKVMGFGHRVYKTKDPRAKILEKMSEEVGVATGNRSWFDMSEKLEQLVLAGEKPLYPNVDFYSASMYYQMNIPFELYTPIFAVSRIAGWTAHILEQHGHNRIIRPAAEYTGPEQLDYAPLAQR
jgi:citrate synthase